MSREIDMRSELPRKLERLDQAFEHGIAPVEYCFGKLDGALPDQLDVFGAVVKIGCIVLCGVGARCYGNEENERAKQHADQRADQDALFFTPFGKLQRDSFPRDAKSTGFDILLYHLFFTCLSTDCEQSQGERILRKEKSPSGADGLSCRNYASTLTTGASGAFFLMLSMPFRQLAFAL